MKNLERILRDHPTTASHFVINDAAYLILPQKGSVDGCWAVKVIADDGDSIWITEPERHYETLGGAWLAILLHLEAASK